MDTFRIYKEGLTGSVDTWNSGKKAELANRVSHSSGLGVRLNGRVKEAIK